MNTRLCSGIILLIVAISVIAMEEDNPDMSDWLDPINRDESILNTTLSTTVTNIGGGLFEYVYLIDSGVDNKGIIGDLVIDLSCDLQFEEVELPQVENPIINRDASEDGQHVPAVTLGANFTSSPMGISVLNRALWALNIAPGETAESPRIISPGPPGLRDFELNVNMDTWGWRYDLYEDNDPRIKWINDFRVAGEVIGPACRIDDDEPEIAFLGAAEEPFGINKLLAYADPISDSIEPTSGSFDLSIFYDDNIDKKSFKAKLNGKDVSSFFTPEPGEFEIVTIEGNLKKNAKLHLSVLGKINDKTRGNSKFRSIDNDVFSITNSN